MIRTELLDKLTAVAPALAETDIIPILMNYWFTGDRLMAFNDQVSISVPLKTDFDGAAPGKTLLALVQNSKAKNVDLFVEDGKLRGKMAAAKIELGMQPAKDFVFDMPEKKSKSLPVKDRFEFLDAITACMRSVGRDSSVTDQLGITLVPEDDALLIYSTNNATISHARVSLTKPCPFDDRVILPRLFCEQMIALAKKNSSMHFEVTKDHALYHTGDVELFGRLIISQNPIDFASIVKRHFPESVRNKSVPMPSMIKLILERAVIMTDTRVDQPVTRVSCVDGVMRFYSKTDRGEVDDTVKVENHPDFDMKVEPRLLKAGFDTFDQMLFTKACAVLSKGDAFYMVSAFGG